MLVLKISTYRWFYKILVVEYQPEMKIGEVIKITTGIQSYTRIIANITINVPGLENGWCILSLVDL